MTMWTPRRPATSWIGAVTVPGTASTSSYSVSAGTPGVKPVEADSGSTTSSAPVSATHRSTRATHLSTLDLTLAAVSGPGTGATWTAAAVNALIIPPRSPAGHDRADEHAEQRDHGSERDADHDVADPLLGRVVRRHRRGPYPGRRGVAPH